MPQGEVDAAPQLDLEIDGGRFDAVDLFEVFLETIVSPRIQAGAQTADQGGQRVNGGQPEGLRVGQPPLVEAADQERQAQGARLVIRGALAPVIAVGSDFAEHPDIGCPIRYQRLAKDAGEDILRHTRGQTLGVSTGQGSKGVGGKRVSRSHGGQLRKSRSFYRQPTQRRSPRSSRTSSCKRSGVTSAGTRGAPTRRPMAENSPRRKGVFIASPSMREK